MKGQEIIDRVQAYVEAATPLANLLGAPTFAVLGLKLSLQAVENFMGRIKAEKNYTQEMIDEEANAAIDETNERTAEYESIDAERVEETNPDDFEEADDLDDDEEEE